MARLNSIISPLRVFTLSVLLSGCVSIEIGNPLILDGLDSLELHQSSHADVLLAKALWDVRQGDTPAAVELLTEAWQLDRFNPRYAYVYMIALDSVGRSEEALEVAATVLSRRDDQQIRQVAGNIRAKLGAGK